MSEGEGVGGGSLDFLRYIGGGAIRILSDEEGGGSYKFLVQPTNLQNGFYYF